MDMTSFDIYVFSLCFIVFSLLTAMFTYLIVSLSKMELTMIRHGHRDEAIKEEHNKKKKESRALLWVNRIASLLLCVIFVAAFSFAVFINATEDRPANGIPSIKVVKSESMASKHPDNTYLFENELNDQFNMFDIVICRHLPAEEDLELYDIVIYKQDDIYVIHRIVAIEEPNEHHPDERHFLLQGDAVENPDVFPVLYSQMQGIYEGTRIPLFGSFILFLQSPAGWLCVMLILFVMIAMPLLEKMFAKEKKSRVALLFPDEPEEEEKPAPTPRSTTRVSYAARGRLGEVSTGVLNLHFKDGDTVDIQSLKQKNLIEKGCKRLKIIATGRLDKALTVYADTCSASARKAIIDAGGRLITPYGADDASGGNEA